MPTLGTVKGDLGYQDYDFLQLGVEVESNLMGGKMRFVPLLPLFVSLVTPSAHCSQLKHRHLNDSPWKLKSSSFPRRV